MDMPDVLGYRLDVARQELEKSGFRLDRIILTNPPRHMDDEINDYFRVVRIGTGGDGSLEATVCDTLIAIQYK